MKPNATAGAAAVLLIDVSASTARLVNGTPLFHAMRTAAQRSLDALEAGTDQADVVLADSDPHALIGRLSPNLPALRAMLNDVQPTAERADIAAALALAGRLLALHDGPRRLIVISDLQQTNWSEIAMPDQDDAINALLPPGAQITFVRLDASATDNLALSGPRSYPPVPIINHPIQIASLATNYSQHEAHATVTATIDGAEIPAQTFTLAPLEQKAVVFDAVFTSPGPHRVVLKISGDGGALTADDQACLALEVVEHFPVVLVSDDDVQEPGSASYFITRALAPRGDQFDQLKVRRVGSAALSLATLADAGAVIVSDIGVLPGAAATALVDYLQRGGGVIWLCGDGPVNDNLALMRDTLSQPFSIPFLPAARRELNALSKPLFIADGMWKSRLLLAFDERSQIALSQIIFRRVWSVGDLHPAARLLLRFSDGTPALASSQVGAGQLVVANFSPATAASDLGRYSAFVALMQSLATQIQPPDAARNDFAPGQPVMFALFAGQAADVLEMIDPHGRRVEAFDQHHEGEHWMVSLPHAAEAGFYEVRRNGHLVRLAALNIDPRESDLSPTDHEELVKHLGTGPEQVEVADLGDDGPIVRLRGEPLWDWFLAAAMAAIALELALIGVWKR